MINKSINRYLKQAVLMVAVFALFVPAVTHAGSVLRSGERIVVEGEQVVDGNFYVVGGVVEMTGRVHGDFYASGGTVTIDGEVDDDVVIVAGTSYMYGSVGDDLRIVGGEVIIGGTVDGDVIVVGGVVRVLPTAIIEGELLFFGNDTELQGNIKQSVFGRSDSLLISGPVAGDVEVSSSRPLILGDRASIEGVVTYQSNGDIIRAPGSVVEGDIVKKSRSITDGSAFNTISILTLFFISFTYVFLCKEKLFVLICHSMKTPVFHGVVGLGVGIGLPLIALLLLVSVIGVPLGITIIALYTLLLFITWSLSGIFLGAVLSHFSTGEISLSLRWVSVGTGLVAVLQLVPYVGAILVSTLMVLLVGTIVTIGHTWLRK